VAGDKLGLRMWDCARGGPNDDPSLSRKYVASHESVGYVLSGRATLVLEGQRLNLAPGQSFLVPPGAEHSFRVTSDEPLKVLEAVGPRERVLGAPGSAAGGAGSPGSAGAGRS
jgi:glyoxylate utilization-related uncharacterized protein